MTVPSYTEDLTDIATGDEGSGWVELTGTDQDAEAYNAQGAPAYEDDEYPYIQGLYAVTQDTTKSTAVGSLGYSSGGITIPTDGAVFVWHNYSSPFAFGTYAQGGFRICIGSGVADFNVWYVGGNDKDIYPYGGFVNHVVNPTVTRDNWAGTTTGTLDYIASAVYVLAGPGKGEPHQVDAMRYGRGSAIFEYGETANYCTIAGFAALNDAQAARWGLIQTTSGGYLWKGKMQLGSVTNAVDFRDSNQTIFVQWTPKVTANFNTVEILNTSSNIEMTGFQFICLDPSGTASRGRWLTTANATQTLTSCNYYDWYTFTYGSNATLTGNAYVRCNQITQNGATFDTCAFNESDAAKSLVVDNLAAVTDCTFTSDGSNHAVDLGTIASTASVNWNNYVSGYETYAAGGTSTGNEAILVSVASGQTLTVNVGSGYDTPSYYNTGTGTVSVVSSVTLTIDLKDSSGTTVTETCEVTVVKDSDTSILYNAENVTTGTTDYGFDGSLSGTAVYINVLNVTTYEPVTIAGITLPASNSTITIPLPDDRNYSNP